MYEGKMYDEKMLNGFWSLIFGLPIFLIICFFRFAFWITKLLCQAFYECCKAIIEAIVESRRNKKI